MNFNPDSHKTSSKNHCQLQNLRDFTQDLSIIITLLILLELGTFRNDLRFEALTKKDSIKVRLSPSWEVAFIC